MGNKLLMTDRQIYTADQGGFLCLNYWQVLWFIIDICFLVSRECHAGKLRHKKRTRINPKSLNLLVPRAGVEPARPYERGILSPFLGLFIAPLEIITY